MNDDKAEKLIKRLRELTKQDKLNWVETADEETYLVALSGSSVSVNRFLNEITTQFTYFITIRDTNGKKLTSIVALPDDPSWADANVLFYDAKDKALNADEAIDKILKQLESDSVTT